MTSIHAGQDAAPAGPSDPPEGGEPDPGEGERAPASGSWRLGWPLIAAIALAVRLAYFATAHGPAFDHPIIDADYYDFLGTRIASGAGTPDEPFWQPPLYPFFLGGLYRLFGHTLWAPRLVQAALGATTAALVCALGRRVGVRGSGPRQVDWAGPLAGLLIALHGPLVFYDGEILPTSLSTCLVTLSLWLVTRERPTWRTALGAGAAVGLGALATAPVLLLLLPVAWAMATGRSRRPLVCVAVAVAAALALITPVTLLNRARSGEWILISANSGVNLWIGNNPNVDRTMAIRPGAGWEELIAEPERHGISGAGGQSDYFTNKAIGWCASEPLACAKNLAWKTRLLLVSRELPRNEDLYVVRRQSPVLAALTARVGTVALPYTLLWPLAAAGAALALSRRERTGRVVVGAALALAAPCVLFFVSGRYRAPLSPALCVLSAVSLIELVAPREKRVWGPVAAGFGALVLTVWPVKLAVDRIPFGAEIEYAVGGRLSRLGDDEGAVQAFQRALALRPDYLEAGCNLGLALQRLGRPREAAEAYAGVLARRPDSLDARFGRANALLEAGESALAEQAFKALALELPGAPESWIGLARAALLRGDSASADALAARAEEVAGGSHPQAAEIRKQAAAHAPPR